MRNIDDDPELQAAFVHGMMFATTCHASGLNVHAIGDHLIKVWGIGDIERVAEEYGAKVQAILLTRPQ